MTRRPSHDPKPGRHRRAKQARKVNRKGHPGAPSPRPPWAAMPPQASRHPTTKAPQPLCCKRATVGANWTGRGVKSCRP